MKKLLFTALIAAMVVGLGGASFSAAGDIAPPAFSDIAGHEAEGELTLMGALGIFTGDAGLGGAVKPDDPITRAQFSKIVVTAAGKATTAAGLAGLEPTFTDAVPTWAWGYVNCAFFMGIISGYADGSFGANNPVTYAEAVTMLIRSVTGHSAQVLPGVWPYNFLFYGVDNGFTGGVDVGFANLPCTRGDMAEMLFATMQIQKLSALGAPAGGAMLAGRIFEGAYNGAAVGMHTLAFGDPVYIVGATDYSALLGLNVVAVTKSGKDVFLWKTEGSALTGVFDEQYTDGLGNHFLKLADGTKVPIEAFGDARVVLNGTDIDNPGDPPDYFNDTDLAENDEVIIAVDDAGNAVSIVATRWDLVTFSVPTHFGWDYVDTVTKSTSTLPTSVEFENAGTWDVPTTVAVKINGAIAKPNDLKAWDVVKGATIGADYNDLYALAVTRTVVEGSFVSTRVTYSAGGTKYFVTVKVGDTNKEYGFDYDYGYYSSWPPVAGSHKFRLAEDGLIYCDEGFTPGYPYVVITGAETQVGSTTKYFIIVDNAGKTETYESSIGDLAGAIGWAYVLEIDGADGKVDNLYSHGVYGLGEIAAIGPDNVTIDWGGGSYDFLETTLAYKDPTGIGSLSDATFIGLSGLAVGEDVYILYADDGVGGHSYMLVRDDDTTP